MKKVRTITLSSDDVKAFNHLVFCYGEGGFGPIKGLDKEQKKQAREMERLISHLDKKINGR